MGLHSKQAVIQLSFMIPFPYNKINYIYRPFLRDQELPLKDTILLVSVSGLLL